MLAEKSVQDRSEFQVSPKKSKPSRGKRRYPTKRSPVFTEEFSVDTINHDGPTLPVEARLFADYACFKEEIDGRLGIAEKLEEQIEQYRSCRSSLIWDIFLAGQEAFKRKYPGERVKKIGFKSFLDALDAKESAPFSGEQEKAYDLGWALAYYDALDHKRKQNARVWLKDGSPLGTVQSWNETISMFGELWNTKRRNAFIVGNNEEVKQWEIEIAQFLHEKGYGEICFGAVTARPNWPTEYRYIRAINSSETYLVWFNW